MKQQHISVTRKTKETDITVSLDLEKAGTVSVATTVPFFDHLLTSLAFHGGFSLSVTARGDTEADPHHLVEDTGIVLGQVLRKRAESESPLQRFGHAVIPMDEALAEVVLDVSGRSHLVYVAEYPQERCGTFDTALIKEFLLGLIRTADITLHTLVRYGENSHHMAEALFKALGKVLKIAYTRSSTKEIPSTKGVLE
ncbi:MAG: imidazoleglycerol-phosphate dehydratase HisB [Spirochaetales bacterium]|nr:imidazoleglycerol-phosphate dehydratase HisB [Spirochaetales bacterium]